MIDNDKIGQTPAEFDNVIENIFKVFCGMNFHKEKSSCKIRANKIQPIRGRPSLMYTCVIPSLKIFLSKILSAHKMVFLGFNRLLETFINNLLRIYS